MKIRGILALALTLVGCAAGLAQDGAGTSLFKLPSFVTSTQITSNQNNYTATDGTNTCAARQVLRISTDASRNITGLSCAQVEGAIRVIHNVGAFSAVLTNQDAGSTAANRFLFGVDTTLATNTSITVRYDAVAQRWRAITTPGSGGGGGVTSYNGRTGAVTATATDVPIPNYLTGLTLSTAGSSSTFGVAIGYAADDGNAALMNLASAYTKTTSSWAVGTATGSLDTGAIANSTWYHIFLIRRADTGVVDVLISTSPTAPTMPTNYTQKRRIGSMKTNGSAQWTKFIQYGDDFSWDVPVADYSVTNPGTLAVTRTLTVPTGIVVEAKLFVAGSGLAGDPGPGAIYLSDLSVTDGSASIASYATINVYTPNSGALIGQLGVPARIFTNTSAQIRSRLQISNANIRLDMNTLGWKDRRGRD